MNDNDTPKHESSDPTRIGARPAKRQRRPVDFTKLKAFGMWADRTETDEELLSMLRSGFGPRGDGPDESHK